MKTINVRELHLKTGDWVRRAGRGETVVITDRRNPVARLEPAERAGRRTPFGQRRLVSGFDRIAPIRADSTDLVSRERDRA